jgi:hypothetical protein
LAAAGLIAHFSPYSGRPYGFSGPDRFQWTCWKQLIRWHEGQLDWQSVRTWAWLIREAEELWSEDARFLQRLGAAELLQVVQEVPPRLRRRVNLWLEHFHVLTRLQ